MKKAIAAAAVLALVFGAALWNIRNVERFTDELSAAVERSRRCETVHDHIGAAEALRHAIELWEGASGYTLIFLRHAEVDAVSDAFYELLSLLEGETGPGTEADYQRLTHHLRCIDETERITWRSVF